MSAREASTRDLAFLFLLDVSMTGGRAMCISSSIAAMGGGMDITQKVGCQEHRARTP